MLSYADVKTTLGAPGRRGHRATPSLSRVARTSESCPLGAFGRSRWCIEEHALD